MKQNVLQNVKAGEEKKKICRKEKEAEKIEEVQQEKLLETK